MWDKLAIDNDLPLAHWTLLGQALGGDSAMGPTSIFAFGNSGFRLPLPSTSIVLQPAIRTPYFAVHGDAR